jgi:cysteine-rich repeat protein
MTDKKNPRKSFKYMLFAFIGITLIICLFIFKDKIFYNENIQTSILQTSEEAVCGNEVIEGEEECDDGNLNENDSCKNDCTYNICGDGVIHNGIEICDDGNLDDSDECPWTCQPSSCGDGFIHEGFEECDDGNLYSEDDCDDLCRLNRN